jgi:hypothetical protein
MMNRTDSGASSWRKSSYSGGGNQCVEIAVRSGGKVAVRDTKNRDGGTHVFTSKVWASFIDALKTEQL